MKTEEKEQNQKTSEVLEGFNPRVYRSLSVLFIVLTIINLAAVIFAFARTGYGLWHAEDALSCIAKIDGSFDDVNKSVLNIELHADDAQMVTYCIDNIKSYHQEMADTASKFRGINIKGVDETLPARFESTMGEVESYYNSIAENLDNIKAGTAAPTVLRNSEAETMRDTATASLKRLFNEADEATYLFFCKVGQRFLFVLLFLLLTMATGLYAISRIKKHDLAFATELQSSKQKTANIRQKAVDIAYTNVVTNLKNRYALMEELDERIKAEDVTLALFNFNSFKTINETFGRDYGDDYVAYISKKLVKSFGDDVEIFSTDADEFCIVFDKNFPKSKTTEVAQQILAKLSQPVQIRNASIQLTAAGCLCTCLVNQYASASKLFVAMDQKIRQTKAICAEHGTSQLVTL